MSEGDQSLLPSDHNSQDRYSSGPHNSFIQNTLESSTCNAAVFINRGFGGAPVQERHPLNRTLSRISIRSHVDAPVGPIVDRSHHIFCPFFGGVDDRVALRFVLQLAKNSNVTVTIIHIQSLASSAPERSDAPEVTGDVVSPTGNTPDVSAAVNHEAQDAAFLHTLRDSLPPALANRVVFSETASDKPLSACLDHAKQEVSQSPKNAGDLIVLGRGKHIRDLFEIEGSTSNASAGTGFSDMKKILGSAAASILSGGLRASVLVVQAGANPGDN